ncbi:MAG: TIGR02594 family protein [Chloroflexi bacterium]|nr:TIGR02594 family protein [Chloroflexota bacterium]
MTQNIVTANALSVRAGPGTQFRITGYVRLNDTVEVFEASPDGLWKKVRTPEGLTGWCSARYLAVTATGGETETAPENAAGKYYVTARGLVMREGPRTTYRIVAYLSQGEIVDALGFSADGMWVNLRKHNGITGWSSSVYLAKLSQGSPAPGAAETGLHRAMMDKLNIREGAGAGFRIVGELALEETVDAVEISPDKVWLKIVTARGLRGWCLRDFLVSLGAEGRVQAHEEYPWLPIAFGEFGMREFPGSPDNPRILEYLNSTVLESKYDYLPDETDWCAAFVNWCVEKAGIPSNNSPMAVSWTRWGRPLAVPRRGCVVTFKWDNGGSHVAFYLGESGAYIHALGGNQNDAVWINSYKKVYASSYRAY